MPKSVLLEEALALLALANDGKITLAQLRAFRGKPSSVCAPFQADKLQALPRDADLDQLRVLGDGRVLSFYQRERADGLIITVLTGANTEVEAKKFEVISHPREYLCHVVLCHDVLERNGAFKHRIAMVYPTGRVLLSDPVAALRYHFTSSTMGAMFSWDNAEGDTRLCVVRRGEMVVQRKPMVVKGDMRFADRGFVECRYEGNDGVHDVVNDVFLPNPTSDLMVTDIVRTTKGAYYAVAARPTNVPTLWRWSADGSACECMAGPDLSPGDRIDGLCAAIGEDGVFYRKNGQVIAACGYWSAGTIPSTANQEDIGVPTSLRGGGMWHMGAFGPAGTYLYAKPSGIKSAIVTPMAPIVHRAGNYFATANAVWRINDMGEVTKLMEADEIIHLSLHESSMFEFVRSIPLVVARVCDELIVALGTFDHPQIREPATGIDLDQLCAYRNEGNGESRTSIVVPLCDGDRWFVTNGEVRFGGTFKRIMGLMVANGVVTYIGIDGKVPFQVRADL